MLRYVIGLVSMLTILSACETDLNLTGPYQEKALVYALLDPNDDVHLFRIQKAFLGEESAFIMALEPDSSYFPLESIRVELIGFNADGDEYDRWTLTDTIIDNKETGDPDDQTIDFFAPEQRLYKLDQLLGQDSTYQIVLTKIGVPEDSVIADASTSMIKTRTFSWTTPSFAASLNQAQPMDLYGENGQFKNYTIRFKTARRAKQYEVWLRFHYREVLQGDETAKTIEWRVSKFELESNDLNHEVLLVAEGIYARIASELSPVTDIIRYIGKANGASDDPYPMDGWTQDFDIFIRMAGEELFEYIDINQPSSSGALTQKPVYTNVNNGLGVFSSRTMVEFNDLRLTTSASQQLVDGEFTQGLGFVDD